MDWKLAKNYTIIFLLILNLILFIANFFKESQYKLSLSQKNILNNYLENNKIYLKVEIPTRYYPMQQLKAKPKAYDYLKLQKLFFEDSLDIKRTEEFNNTIFSSENAILKINENNVFYKDNNKINNFDYSKSNILRICSEYIKKLEREYIKLNLSIYSEKEDYVILEYNQIFNRNLIFGNFVKFKIYKDGTKEIYFRILEQPSFFEKKIDISSADEVVYIFSKEIKELYPNESIVITNLDLGYYSEELESLDSNDFFSLTPYYRFFLENKEKTFYINAYNNSFFESKI